MNGEFSMAQDVFSKMAGDPWLLNEDGYLNIETDIKEIIYHPSLNVILICTSSGVVRVLDVNSGVILQSSLLSAENQNEVTCRHISGNNRVLFCDGQAIGVRSDYNGVLLLDSILQKAIADPKDNVKLELPLSEAIILKQCLVSVGITGNEHVINELSDQILKAQKNSRRGIKAQKWNTICLDLPLESLRVAASSSISELLSKNLHTPGLGVASSVQERLSELTGDPVNAADRKSMASESRRRETFATWPHMDYQWALPDQMAQSGFYHQPNTSGDDRAMCFTCNVCLVCWERTDEPWSEHERHSPICPFVAGEYTQNVPLSVTHATNPAVDVTHHGNIVKVLGASSIPEMIPTANSEALVSVFDISGKIQRTHTFYVTQFDSHILERLNIDFASNGARAINDETKTTVEKRLTALAIVSCPDRLVTKEKEVRPIVVCGLTIRCTPTEKLPSNNRMETNSTASCVYLVVYDFTFTKEAEEVALVAKEPKKLPYMVYDNNSINNATSKNAQQLSSSLEAVECANSLMKHMKKSFASQIYKTCIPGESDDVFLPPSSMLNKPHSGPRVLSAEMQTETDSSLGNTFMQQLINKQLSGTATTELHDLSISDHIIELKKKKKRNNSPSLNYSRAQQCIPLPEQCRHIGDLEATNIFSTPDQLHVLVVVKSVHGTGSFLMLFALNFDGASVKIIEDPVSVRELQVHEQPVQVSILPKLERFTTVSENCSIDGVEGNLVVVCVDGAVRIVELATLQTICFAKLDSDKFVSAAYCISLDRLCASTERGSLHFYALNDTDNESSEENEEDDLCPIDKNTSQCSNAFDNYDLAHCFSSPPHHILPASLKTLRSLCYFESVKTPYTAVVPACWTESLQTQRPKRHLPKSDNDQQLTKSWRLQTDITTWDEHIFEITLPASSSLGHVDVQFMLQPSSCVPHVEVTLLKQITTGIGHKKDVKFSVDETVTFEMLQSIENPVVSQEYLRAQNAEILAGPVNLASHLDINELGGMITLTSPKLFKAKVRHLLLHIKAVYPKDFTCTGFNNNKKNKQRFENDGGTSEAKANRKIEFYLGCDSIHEMSVSVYCTKHTVVPHERTHRICMLESNVFVQSLLVTVDANCNNETMNDILDILNWVAAIRLTRNRNNNGTARMQQLEFVGMLENNLNELVRRCFVMGGRSIAHKCMKFIVICFSGAKDISVPIGDQFNKSFLKTLLLLLNGLPNIKSAGGMQNIFALLLKVTKKENSSAVVAQCVTALDGIAQELDKRKNPYHLLLRSRFGLYGTPLQPELFDIEPPLHARTSLPSFLTTANVVNNTLDTNMPNPDTIASYSFNRETISPKDVLTSSETKLKYKNLKSVKSVLRGLIETQPLHFSCHSAGEGTRLERADANSLISTTAAPAFLLSAAASSLQAANNSLSSNAATIRKDVVVQQLLHNLHMCVDKTAGTYAEVLRHNVPAKAAQNDSGTSYSNYEKEEKDRKVADAIFKKLSNLSEKFPPVPEERPPVPTTTASNSQVAWHQILLPPPQQVIVVERLHVGARRHVVLDFGQPVLLTDILIQACSDLISLSVDVWLKDEEVDEVRIAVASDIATRNLMLNDLQPPPLCRYLKITAVGRHGISSTRCRIPAGYYYGHMIVLPEDVPSELSEVVPGLSHAEVEKQLNTLSKLFEDISCRYSLACSKLKEMLHPFLMTDIKNAAHLSAYMNVAKDKSSSNNQEHNKVFSAYQEILTYQHQLNTVRNVMSRLEQSTNRKFQDQRVHKDLASTPTDKLTATAECLLETMLSLEATANLSEETCKRLFNGLCVCQSSRLQLLAALFLDKCCNRKRFWGNFLANTLAKMFATSYTQTFPQDRLFVLLAYLSRKCSDRSAVIDAALRVLADELRPLTEPRKSLLAVTVDLPLISWLLMYLSLQLDRCALLPKSTARWDWVFGEMIGKANMENLKNNGRKKPCKRVLPSCMLFPYDIRHPLLKLRCTMGMANDALKVQITKHDNQSSSTKINSPKKVPERINNAHCLTVARGLLQLILALDHSSSADMMLLAFKVSSKLTTMAKLQLGELITHEKLLDLIQFSISSNMPWAHFALACFLQDVMEFSGPVTEAAEDAEMETDVASNWATNDLISDVESMCESFSIDEIVLPSLKPNDVTINVTTIPNNTNTSNSSTNNNNTNFPPLPSVYESEDSEFEEILEDIDKVRRSAAKKTPKTVNTSNTTNLSTCIDARLEIGVEQSSEILIKRILIKNSQTLLKNITTSAVEAAANTNDESNLLPWPNEVLQSPSETTLSNHNMLKKCFDVLFENLQLQHPTKIEQTLQLWLALNCAATDKFHVNVMPQIPLKPYAVKALISAMAWTPGLSLTTWCYALQTLTLVCQFLNYPWTDLYSITVTIVDHPDFVQFFMRLLTGAGLNFTGKMAGPTLCSALFEFLVCLHIRCDVSTTPYSQIALSFQNYMLQIVYQLSQPTGPIATKQGPLDAQCKILQSIEHLKFSRIDFSIARSILESAATLVSSYVHNVDKVRCINIGEKQNNTMTSTFGDIFASVLGSDANKQDRPISHDYLLITLLKIIGKFVQTPLPPGGNEPYEDLMDTGPSDSQTDESKAEQIQQETQQRPTPRPCYADIVLQHHPTVIRLCQSLAACKSSSLSMLANVTQKTTMADFNEPNTVGDAVFHILTLMAKKASNKELIIQPLLMFMLQTPQLSEPLLWFVLQVLDTEEAIRSFVSAGGIDVLGGSLVSSSNAPNTIARQGTISTVMQHFSGINPTSDANSVISATSATKKLLQVSLENKLSLINFAPFCTIKCHSGTAQPADILIQGLSGVTHRRARSPLWSYHFYPDEMHTELVLTLPSAVLLKEVQLQPHSGGLVTCPSAVALEYSSNGPTRFVPACPPIPTSGMTFIRLHFPVPKVVNCLLIRLYKPRDANSIGLLQIRLLGNFAFSTTAPGGNNASEVVDDESHCRHSLGWLRLLHHCITVPTEEEFKNEIVQCTSQVPDLLRTCCGLLLVPSHVLPVYLPCLERVLRELALHSPANSMEVIRLLLDNRSGVCEPIMSADCTWQDRLLINATGYQSACELLYQICDHQDETTMQRVQLILDWLRTTAQQTVLTGNTDACNPVHISAAASILWSAKESHVDYDLKSLVTTDLFDAVYNLKAIASKYVALKYSLDSLLCSIFYIRPELFPILLQRIGVLVLNLSTDHDASISDDRKDSSDCMTDDSKRNFDVTSEWYSHLVIGKLAQLNLTSDDLDTVALVSRSPTAIQQLLDSGLPKLLNSAILEFCSAEKTTLLVPMAKLDNVTCILRFFTDVSDERVMRDWLGSSDGSSFWLHLLHWLCKKPTIQRCNLQSEAQLELEEVCVKFLTKCCLCHPSNQTRLAKVLCEVIALQSDGISSFLRRLILQLLLENEKVPVSIEADETLYKSTKLTQAYLPAHPAFKQTYNRAMLYLKSNTRLIDVLEQYVYFNTTYKMENNCKKKLISNYESSKKAIMKWFPEDSDLLSMAAGVTAKDKRAKDAKNQLTSTPLSKKKRYTSESTNVLDMIGGRLVKCEAYSEQPLPLSVNLGQLLRLIETKGTSADWPCIHLKICQSKNTEDRPSTSTSTTNLPAYQQQHFCSALQIFSSMGGLALLAQHLPTVYPEAVRPPPVEKALSDQFDKDWIKVEDCGDEYEDVEEAVGTSPPSKAPKVVSHIPPHSLTAFGLFLRLPGYAEVLLKDMKRALCLLRLVLGVTDDGEGGDIFHSSVADSLPTLPFDILKRLYEATPLSTDDGRLLRSTSINTGIVHLLLACLGIFTHSQQGTVEQHIDLPRDKKAKDERASQLYWAKGTGFGTGSTQQSWNVEQALIKQKSEEDHVTVLLEVLATYINPGDEVSEELGVDVLPATFHDLLIDSTLLPALCSYLRNDSVLDMARHIPLYKAVLQLLRALAASVQLIDLLLPMRNRSNKQSVIFLLKNMRDCVDTYASKLTINTGTKFNPKLGEQLIEDADQEGLAALVPDIQETADLVSRVTMDFVDADNENYREFAIPHPIELSVEEHYMKIMKCLQFGSYEMINELHDGTLNFVITHHFESTAKSTSEQSHPARVKRIAQEAVTLSTSLPLSYSSSVFVRYDTSRLDVMKVLITGPADTPYANGCFELDVFFPPDYPQSPMLINLETTGRHTVRFNPNLYNDGKVCLSVLNTWHGRPEEKWNTQTSSFLQVLVSIQSLILVSEPYFNEPGYERARGTPAGTASSRDYNLNICQATVRWAMLEQILNPCPCFKDVIHAHFYLKRNEILVQVQKWIEEVESETLCDKKSTTTRSTKKSPTATLEVFKMVYKQLKDELDKLKAPAGVQERVVAEEDEEEEMESPKTPTNFMDDGDDEEELDEEEEEDNEEESDNKDDSDEDMDKIVNAMSD